MTEAIEVPGSRKLPANMELTVRITTRTIVNPGGLSFRVIVSVFQDKNDPIIVECESVDPVAALTKALPEALRQFPFGGK